MKEDDAQKDGSYNGLGVSPELLGLGHRTVVFLSEVEIRDTPGLARALSTVPITWTERVRETLAGKGLDMREGAPIYVLTIWHPQLGPGRAFCNARNAREAYEAFSAEIAPREEEKQKNELVKGKQERDAQVQAK